jgi:hypothetical protein
VRAPTLLFSLLSGIAYAGDPSTDVRPGEFFQRLSGDVVLSNKIDPAWGIGPLDVTGEPGDVRDDVLMEQAVDLDRLPRDLRRWRGQSLRPLDGRGPACTAKIVELRLVGSYIPVGDPTRWERIDKDHQPPGVRRAWRRSRRLLVGRLSRDCGGTYWQRADATPPASMTWGKRADDALRALALAEFHRLPEYQAVQKSWEASTGRRTGESAPEGMPRDGLYEREATTVLRFDLPGVTLVTHFAYAFKEGFYDGLLAVWELRGGEHPSLSPRHILKGGAMPQQTWPTIAVDLRQNGRFLFVYKGGRCQGALYETERGLIDQPAFGIDFD